MSKDFNKCYAPSIKNLSKPLLQKLKVTGVEVHPTFFRDDLMTYGLPRFRQFLPCFSLMQFTQEYLINKPVPGKDRS